MTSGTFTLISWNVNGIRSGNCDVKKILNNFQADVICFQETKVTRDALSEPTAVVSGYSSYFSFSRKKSGYSGVATFCKNGSMPVRAEEGIAGTLPSAEYPDAVGHLGDIPLIFSSDQRNSLDAEGRCVITQHRIQPQNLQGDIADVVLMNVYCPRADPDRPERETLQILFYEALELRTKALIHAGLHVVIAGDINCSLQPIDHCDPGDLKEFWERPGRKFFANFLLELSSEHEIRTENCEKIVDSFRYFYPSKKLAFTCWNTMKNARSTNYGTRLDYILVDTKLLQLMSDSRILDEVHGSDHCPVVGVFECSIIDAEKTPQICTSNFPEFIGKQKKLSSFFSTKSKDVSIDRMVDDNMQQENSRIPNLEPGGTGKKRKKTIADFFTKKTVEYPEPQQNFSCVDFDTIQQEPKQKREQKGNWNFLMKATKPVPLCRGHQEPCVLRRVKKAGPNFNKQFYVCARGEGHINNPESRCNHFEWLSR